ncbi:L-threonylcarbamoyladenylate synthase [Candidatus Omnitrophota bacterium]
MKSRVIKIDPSFPKKEEIKKAAETLREGGLVVIPTETVYGIAANMSNQKALRRLYEVKERPKDKPFSLHLPLKEDVEKYAVDISPAAYRLMDKFWPGPLTLVLKSKDDGKVGVRIPNHRITLSIILEADVPVVCPSANLSGKAAPVSAEEALKELDGLVDLVVDAGKTSLGRESTVVDASQSPVVILRQGVIAADQIKMVVEKKMILFVCTGNSCRSVMAKALMEKKLKEAFRRDIEVSSAGITMLGGMGASEATKDVLRQEGIDVSMHSSKRVSEEMVRGADIILVMEKLHEKRLLELAPEAKNRLFLLKEFAKIDDNDLDIEDPIAKPAEFYARTLETIKGAIERIVKII